MPRTYKPDGKKIIQHRRERNMTRAELAVQTELSVTTLKSIETGSRKCYLDTLEVIAMALKVEDPLSLAVTPSATIPEKPVNLLSLIKDLINTNDRDERAEIGALALGMLGMTGAAVGCLLLGLFMQNSMPVFIAGAVASLAGLILSLRHPGMAVMFCLLAALNGGGVIYSYSKRSPQQPTLPATVESGPVKPDVPAAKRPLSILLPAYFYPGGDSLKEWEEVYWAASQLKGDHPLIVILNIDSGPGKGAQPDSNYATLVTRLAKEGAKVIGYISDDFGKRDSQSIKADIDTWLKRYPGVSGFFIDGLPAAAGQPDFMGWCQHARLALRAKGVNEPLIIGNPGIEADKAFGQENGFDALCIHVWKWNQEGGPKLARPQWSEPKDAIKYGGLVYRVDGADLQQALDKATSEQLDFIYLTDQTGDGNDVLWTRLPSKPHIWRPLVQKVADWNRSNTIGNPGATN